MTPQADLQTLPASAESFVGRGMLAPVLRAGDDFLNGTGAALLAANLLRALGTKPREIPWDYTLGLDVERYRNQVTDEQRAALIRAEVTAALQAADARLLVQEVLVRRDSPSDTLTHVTVLWFLRAQNDAANILAGPYSTDVLI